MTVYSFADALAAVRANTQPVTPPKETAFAAGLTDDYIRQHPQAQLLVEDTEDDIDEPVPVVSDYSGKLRQLSRAIMESDPHAIEEAFGDAIRERIIDRLLDLKVEMAMSLGAKEGE